MSLPHQSKGAGGQQGKFRLSSIFEDIFDSEDPTEQIGGYWDLVINGGAEDLFGETPVENGDGVHLLKNLVENSTASDLKIVTSELDANASAGLDRQMIYRTDISYPTGESHTMIPLMFYPEGHFAPLHDDDDDTQPSIYMAEGNINVPEGETVEEYTLILCGVQTLHEIDVPDEVLNDMDEEGITSMPMPKDEPGILAIGVGQDTEGNAVVDYYIDGEKQDASGVDPGSLLGTSGDPLNPNDFLMFLTMPCWAMQKLLFISRKITDEEVEKVTKRMARTMRVRRPSQ